MKDGGLRPGAEGSLASLGAEVGGIAAEADSPVDVLELTLGNGVIEPGESVGLADVQRDDEVLAAVGTYLDLVGIQDSKSVTLGLGLEIEGVARTTLLHGTCCLIAAGGIANHIRG